MPSRDRLLTAAREIRERAYAPYSNFQVGAALETSDGTIVAAANVENASYGLSMCAERNAIARAIAEGHREFRAIAIAGPDGALTSPCGACRQVLAEFLPSMPLFFTAQDGVVETTVDALLPHSFGPKSLL